MPQFASPSSSNADPALGQLHSRTWLLHWSLFVYFNHPQGRTLLLETFLQPTYLNTIQTSAPWVLRYLVAAAVLSRKSSSSSSSSAAGGAAVSSRVRYALKELVKIIQMEAYNYSDPLTRFLSALYLSFDFPAAQAALEDAVQVVGNDFFLEAYRDEFVENARYLVSEAYCRVGGRIEVG